MGKFLKGALISAVCLLGTVNTFAGPILSLPPNTNAFSANFVGDRDNISIYSFGGDYNKLLGGALNTEPRAIVAKEFYKDHPDNYDFLVVFTTFEFNTGTAQAFQLGLKNDVQGIGLPIFDYSNSFGSKGKLHSYIDMAAITRYNMDPLQPDFENVLATLSHEVLHQWGSFVKFKNPATGLPDDSLLGKDNAHWSYLLESNASVQYGAKWQDNGDGTFRALATRKFYSPLDLYLMGIYGPEEVPPFYLIDNNALDKTKITKTNEVVSGTKRTVTVNDIIAQEGVRVPTAANAQKEFRFAFILLTGAGEVVPQETLTKINDVRKAFMTRFAILTGGRAIAQVYPEAMPVNTVKTASEITGGALRLTSANLNDGLTWLRGQQNLAGYWNDKSSTRLRDTAVSLQTLQAIDTSFVGNASATSWLANQTPTTTDYLARQLLSVGVSVVRARNKLVALQNTDGGFGLGLGFDSDAFDTALAILALKHINASVMVLNNAVQYLLTTQNMDGGWSNAKDTKSRSSVTATVLQALKVMNAEAPVSVTALAWLLTKQNVDGGFGDSLSTVYDTANVLNTLVLLDQTGSVVIDKGVAYLLSQQSIEGSWGGSTYNTALAVRTLKRMNFVNWAVTPKMIARPLSPRDGAQVQLNVTIKNDSGIFTPVGNLRIYDGDPTAGGVPIASDFSVPPIAPNNAVTLDPYWDSTNKAGAHVFYAVMDPDALQNEVSKNDNSATVSVMVQPAPVGVELSVVTGDIAALPVSPNRLPTTMGISANIRNFGLTDATNVKVTLWKGGIGTGTNVAEVIVNIPNRSSVVTNFTNILNAAGTTLYSIQVDKDNTIAEAIETNNTASIRVVTSPSVDFEVLASDISVNTTPAIFGNDVVFSVNLHNFGTLDTPATTVNYIVTNGTTTRILASNALQLKAGASTTHKITWRVDLTGALIFTAVIDQTGLIAETDETNNRASFNLPSQVLNSANLTVNYKDLTLNPTVGNEGSPVSFSMIVRNIGNVTANNVAVNFYDGEPTLGGVQIGATQTIASLAAGANATVSVTWPSIPSASSKLIYAVVDPNNVISESREDDNSAFKTLKVLSLPDLAISTSDITVNPAFPSSNQTIAIAASVANLGQQSATNVLVEAYYGVPANGGVLIGRQTLTTLASNASSVVNFSYALGAAGSAKPVVIQLDPNSQILERDRSNNIALRNLVVQDGSAYITEPFFSPNGDGIKDSTDFFFRLTTPDTVKVNIVDGRNNVVRTISNSTLTNISQGSVSWDGRTDTGILAFDGEYRFQLMSSNAQQLAEVKTILDTNHTSILKAIGVKSELFRNLTCGMGYAKSLSLSSDETEFDFYIDRDYNPTKQYSKGVYKMNDSGADIKAIIPNSWINTIPPELVGIVPAGSISTIDNLVVSKDRSTYVFMRTDYQYPNSYNNWFVYNAKDKTIKLFAGFDANVGQKVMLSPDGRYIYQMAYTGNLIRYDRVTLTSTPYSLASVVAGYSSYVSTQMSPDGRFITFLPSGGATSTQPPLIFNTKTLSFVPVNYFWGDKYNLTAVTDVVWAPDSSKFVLVAQKLTGSNSDINFYVMGVTGTLLNTFARPKETIGSSLNGSYGGVSWSSSSNEFAIKISGGESFNGSTVPVLDPNKNYGGVYIANVGNNTIKQVAQSKGVVTGGIFESYHVSTWDGSNWIERGVLHYGRYLREQNLNLTKYLPDADGEYKVRIRQIGLEAAHVESVSLLLSGNRLVPAKATKLKNTLLNKAFSLVSNIPRGEDVLGAIRYPDNEWLDLYQQEMEVEWTNVTKGNNVILALTAREEALSKLKTLPFSYPVKKDESYQYQITNSAGLVYDGKLQGNDNLTIPLFKQFTRPSTGHPPSTVYGYVTNDSNYLYGALDFTVDNTMDGQLDWASMRVKTQEGWKDYRVNISNNKYGKVSFGKTRNAPYSHKYYEFRIPLSELGVTQSNVVDIVFQAYGTAAIVISPTMSSTLLPESGTITWDPASNSLLYDSGYQGLWTIHLDENNKVGRYFANWPATVDKAVFSPSGRKLLFKSNFASIDTSGACPSTGYANDSWSFESLQNLIVDLRVIRSSMEGGVILKGTASDLYLDRYTLEYASVSTPDTWNPIAPSVSAQVIDARFTSWVPPTKGNYFVRLTVFDKAGNSRSIIQRISWGNVSSISNLYLTPAYISPNGDGVQDTTSLHYRVLEPVNLNFDIFNESGDMVRSIARSHSIIGAEFDLIWDGRDNVGIVVPDGKYKITVQNYQFFVTVDNTAPQVTIKLIDSFQTNGKILSSVGIYAGIYDLRPAIQWTSNDANIKLLAIDKGAGITPLNWVSFKNIGSLDADIASGEQELFISEYTGNSFRLTATDAAGNVASVNTLLAKEVVVNVGKAAIEYVPTDATVVVNFIETIVNASSQIIFQSKVRNTTNYTETDITNLAPQSSYSFLMSKNLPIPDTLYDVRFKIIDVNGVAYYSNTRSIKTSATLPSPTTISLAHGFFVADTVLSVASAVLDGVDVTDELSFYADPRGNLMETRNISIEELNSFIVSRNPASIANGTANNYKYDPRYVTETEVDSINNSAKSIIVLGNSPKINTKNITIKNLKQCTPYRLISRAKYKILGAVSQKITNTTYSSWTKKDFVTPCVTVTAVVNYPAAAQCGLATSGSTSIDLTPDALNTIGLKLLTLSSIDAVTGVENILYNVNKPKANQTYQYKVDSNITAEGKYRYQVKLVNDINQVIIVPVDIIVDKTAPTSQITYPVEGQKVCAIPRVNPKGGFDNIVSINISVNDPVLTGPDKDVKDSLESTMEIASSTLINGQPDYQPLPMTLDETRTSLLKPFNADLHQGTFAELENYDGNYILRLKGTDIAGNTQCDVRTFSIDGTADADVPTVSGNIISPNNDGVLDNWVINYSVNEPMLTNIDIYSITIDGNGKIVLGPSAVRSLVNSKQILSGSFNSVWDGTSNAGTVVPDGKYVAVVLHKDACGNLARYQTSVVTVDTILPVVSINSPLATSKISLITQILGSVTDSNLKSYTLEYGVGNTPSNWAKLATGARNLNNELITNWNTSGLNGIYSLRLSANDFAGNTSNTIVAVNVSSTSTILNNLLAQPRLFSPNNDAILETTTIQIGLNVDAGLTVQVKNSLNLVIRTIISSDARVAGVINYTWNGKDDTGSVVPDGDYKITVNAISTANSTISQTAEFMTVVDTKGPTVIISRPVAGFTTGSGSIIGSISDVNLNNYNVSITSSPTSPSWNEVSSGVTNQTSALLGSLEGLVNGDYAIKIMAVDAGGTITNLVIPFKVDNTPPIAVFVSPQDSAFIGVAASPVSIDANIQDANISTYTLNIGVGNAPTGWTELIKGTNNISASLMSLDVTTYTDGIYTLRLIATDLADNVTQSDLRINIDNTVPVAKITLPTVASYIKATNSVKGIATDSNFSKYQVFIAPGNLQSANLWSELTANTSSVNAGELLDWQLIPADGPYILKLLVTDKANNTSEVKVPVIIDLTPPAVPTGLIGLIQNVADVGLTWKANTEPDVIGYNVYSNGKLLTTLPVVSPNYVDLKATEGINNYTVTAVDKAGWESAKSVSVQIAVDTTPPTAKLYKPEANSIVKGLVDVFGTAHSVSDFKEYRILVGQGLSPTSWQLIRRSPVPMLVDVLANWNTVVLVEGSTYTIKLETEDLTGNIGIDTAIVTIDNLPPAMPTGLIATATGTNVSLTWNKNTEADLLGYLVYRNVNIANATSVVVGDLRPYAVVNANYSDLTLADGTYSYTVVAIDAAGNTSTASLPSKVILDNRAPHAVITTPVTASTFDLPLYISASSSDNDIAQVQFQYRPSGTTTWINLGAADSSLPYDVMLDASALGLVYGNFDLQAVATDIGGLVDTSPAFITITYKDLVRPIAVTGLKVLVAADNVTLKWTANPETDIAGYHIERKLAGGAFTRITVSPVTSTTFPDSALAEDTYYYQIIAVDTSNNESDPSAVDLATVYTPSLIYPFTPVNNINPISILGQGITQSSVQTNVTTSTGTTMLSAVNTDAQGNFTMNNLALANGLNVFGIQMLDTKGNLSKPVATSVITGVTPSQPTGFAATAALLNVTMNWNANPETDIAGYRLFDNGVPMLSDIQIAGLTATTKTNNPAAVNLVDGNVSSSWSVRQFLPATITGEWVELTLPSQQLVSKIDITWLSAISRAIDFDIQVNTGTNWLTIKQVRNTNANASYSTNLSMFYPTNKIRLVMLKAANANSWQEVINISEIKIFSVGMQSTTTDKQTVTNGIHNLTVTAVSALGFESMPSAIASLAVGDVTPPDAVTLSGVATASSAVLNWSAATATDVKQYDIYRDGVLIASHTDSLNLSYTDKSLLNGTYNYHVVTVDSVGNVSASSNIVSLAINVTVANVPTNLAVAVVPSGGALSLSWQGGVGGGTTTSYKIMRSTVAMGPYTRITTVPATQLTYVDSGLTNGTTYFYVVRSVDSLGNESLDSNEQNGIPADTVRPVVALSYPILPGYMYTTGHSVISVSGFSDSDANVSLNQNGNVIDNTLTAVVDSSTTINVPVNESYMLLTPDGTQAIYFTTNNAVDGMRYFDMETGANIRFKDVSSNINTLSFDNQLNLNWLADGSGFVSAVYNNLYIVDIALNTTTSLNTSPNDSISAIRLSHDNKSVIVLGTHTLTTPQTAVWKVNIKTKVWTAIAPLSTSNIGGNIAWSEDGQYVSFNIYESGFWRTKVVNVSTGFMEEIDSNSLSRGTALSSNGRYVVFAKLSGMWMYDRLSSTVVKISDASSTSPYNPFWLKAANKFIFLDVANGVYEYSISDGLKKIYSSSGIYTNTFRVTDSGYIGFIDSASATPQFIRLTPKGHFVFKNVNLSLGDNIFNATAVDLAGNASVPSSSIIVNYGVSNRADLVVSVSDIHVIPTYPTENTEAAIQVIVRNQGVKGSFVSDLDLYVIDAAGNNVALINKAVVNKLSPGASQSFTAKWNAGLTGTYSIVAVVDSNGTVTEVSESNNFAIKQQRVNLSTLPELQLTTDKTNYLSNEDVLFNVNVYNSGSTFNGRLDVIIQDINGYSVKTVRNDVINNLVYGNVYQLNGLWNTGSTFAGSYQVYAKLIDNTNNTVATLGSPITITGTAGITGLVTTDKTSYSANEIVSVTGLLKHVSGNSVLRNGTATLRIVDANANKMAEKIVALGDILPGSQAAVNLQWNTSFSAIGNYFITLDLVSNAQIVTQSSTQFTVAGGNTNAVGTLSLSYAAPGVGSSQTATYTLTNKGNAALSQLPTRVQFVDPSLQYVIATVTANHDIAINSNVTGTASFNTTGLSIKAYNILLQVDTSLPTEVANWVTLNSASFSLSDRTAPIVNIRQPINNTYLRGDAKVQVYAFDALSAVSTVSVRLDGGALSAAYIEDIVNNIYALTLPGLTEGVHNVEAETYDIWGNLARSPVASFIVDNTAPMVSITGVTEAAAYNVPITPIISIIDANLSKSSIALNGVPYTSGMVVANDGQYTLTAYADDLAGNTANVGVNFIVDTQAPTVVVTGVTEGTSYKTQVTPLISISDTNLVTQTITLNGQTYVSGAPVNIEGAYQLVVTAIDIAGNKTIVTTNFEIDITPPVILVSGVVDGGAYSIDVSPVVTVSDQNLVSQTMTLNGQVFVANQVVSIEGSYVLDISAVDAAGNTATAMIKFIIDKTDPVISISGVVDGGIYNAAVTPVITVTDANLNVSDITINGQPFVSGSVFTTEGLQQLIVTADDTAGNQNIVSVSFEIDTIAPTVTLIQPQEGEVIPRATTDVAGSTEAQATVYITVPGYSTSTLASTTGNFIFNQVPLVHGDNVISVYAVDRAGNTGVTSIVKVISDVDPTELFSKAYPAQGVLVWAPAPSHECDDAHDDEHENDGEHKHKYHDSNERSIECHTHNVSEYIGHETDTKLSLIGETLNQTVNEYLIVHSESKLLEALRSQHYGSLVMVELPYYDSLNLSGLSLIEIRSMVASGMGLLWLKSSDKDYSYLDDVAGFESEEIISNLYQLNLPDSEISSSSTFVISGKGVKIELDNEDGGYGKNSKVRTIGTFNPGNHAAIVLNDFAQGRFAQVNFDLAGLTNIQAAKNIFASLITHIAPIDMHYYPGGVAKIVWTADNLPLGINALFNETLVDTSMMFINVYSGIISADKLEESWNRLISAKGPIAFNSLVRLPVIKGDYTINGKLSKLDNSFEYLLQEGQFNFSINTDLQHYSTTVVNSLQGLSLSDDDDSLRNYVINIINYAIRIQPSSLDNINYSMSYLRYAYHYMLQMDADVPQIESQLGRLIRMYQIYWDAAPKTVSHSNEEH